VCVTHRVEKVIAIFYTFIIVQPNFSGPKPVVPNPSSYSLFKELVASPSSLLLLSWSSPELSFAFVVSFLHPLFIRSFDLSYSISFMIFATSHCDYEFIVTCRISLTSSHYN